MINGHTKQEKVQEAVDVLKMIGASTDVPWLQQQMRADQQLTVRSAAERRLKRLAKERQRR